MGFQPDPIEIDHVFFLVQPFEGELLRAQQMGLVETYRRKHPGQGTENVCYCFDNLYVELLWINDQAEASSDASWRTGLFQRSNDPQACPFGIAWRGGKLAATTWEYRPQYLPDGLAIRIATDSDDHRQPMMFRSPAGIPPIQMEPSRRGRLQRDSGMLDVRKIELEMPGNIPASPALDELSRKTGLTVTGGTRYSLSIEIQLVGGGTRRLEWAR